MLISSKTWIISDIEAAQSSTTISFIVTIGIFLTDSLDAFAQIFEIQI